MQIDADFARRGAAVPADEREAYRENIEPLNAYIVEQYDRTTGFFKDLHPEALELAPTVIALDGWVAPYDSDLVGDLRDAFNKLHGDTIEHERELLATFAYLFQVFPQSDSLAVPADKRVELIKRGIDVVRQGLVVLKTGFTAQALGCPLPPSGPTFAKQYKVVNGVDPCSLQLVPTLERRALLREEPLGPSFLHSAALRALRLGDPSGLFADVEDVGGTPQP